MGVPISERVYVCWWSVCFDREPDVSILEAMPCELSLEAGLETGGGVVVSGEIVGAQCVNIASGELDDFLAWNLNWLLRVKNQSAAKFFLELKMSDHGMSHFEFSRIARAFLAKLDAEIVIHAHISEKDEAASKPTSALTILAEMTCKPGYTLAHFHADLPPEAVLQSRSPMGNELEQKVMATLECESILQMQAYLQDLFEAFRINELDKVVCLIRTSGSADQTWRIDPTTWFLAGLLDAEIHLDVSELRA